MEKQIDCSLSTTTIVITVYAAGLDGHEAPAFAFVIERKNSIGTREILCEMAGSCHQHRDHNRALLQALADAIEQIKRLTSSSKVFVEVETTSKGFLVRSLHQYFPNWKAKNKWPKKTQAGWKLLDERLDATGIEITDARCIETTPALLRAKELAEVALAKSRGARDRLVSDRDY